jgi:hypothetical protein
MGPDRRSSTTRVTGVGLGADALDQLSVDVLIERLESMGARSECREDRSGSCNRSERYLKIAGDFDGDAGDPGERPVAVAVTEWGR